MNTYFEKIDEIREKIDLIINENEVLDLSSPKLVEKALMVERELSGLN